MFQLIQHMINYYLIMGAAGTVETEGQTLIGLECKTAAFAWGWNVRAATEWKRELGWKGGSALTSSVEQ